MDRELPELALKAAYNKVQAHSWKELPGQREGAGPQPKVCAACASGGRGGESGRRGKERVEGAGRKEEPFLHLQSLPQHRGGFSPALLTTCKR